MPTQMNEKALEALIETALTGLNGETPAPDTVPDNVAAEAETPYTTGRGYRLGHPQDYDALRALDTRYLLDFLQDTQAEPLRVLQRTADWKNRLLDRIHHLISRHGLLHVLRQPLKIDNVELQLMYPLPPAGSGAQMMQKFEQNRFSVTRQVRFSADTQESMDMVLFLNGLPFATLELKNIWTQQTARYHGQEQYRKRDPRVPLFQFGRCLVHFTADTEEVYMTTRIQGAATVFLPFNRGHAHGKGNPPHPSGHRTSYLWEEILRRYTVAEILQHYVRLDGRETDPLEKKQLIFPRYHQLDVVRKLTAHAAAHGLGQFYLIQHSAGSGKSNSITWAAFRLLDVYPGDAAVPGYAGAMLPLFETVIVVTDRRLLDKQLRENIRLFSKVSGLVAPAHSSAELRKALVEKKRIIITTIQKFPFVVDEIQSLQQHRFAVIIDEAHSSQSGIAADEMNRTLGGSEALQDGEEMDYQDMILQAMQRRKMAGNASYFAFTATPKRSTLERFGTRRDDGSFAPFHEYTMKQAIEEQFILDVLANYTTYRSYYEIEKSIEENPVFDSLRAQKTLRRYVEQNPVTIGSKARILLDHFLTQVVHGKKLKGKGKALVVTQSIESAIHYFHALQALLAEKGDPFRIAIAFSGTKKLGGVEYTEDSLNHFPPELDRSRQDDPDYIADKIARYFDMDAYRMLVVANKYLTGFDQPKLCAMYVDKRLQDVQAVQTLSRLNRASARLGKRTEDLFVLDFYNSVEDIQAAFQQHYTTTELTAPTDVNILHDLKSVLDSAEVYTLEEVQTFNLRYFSQAAGAELDLLLNAAADRFNMTLGWDQHTKADYKIKARQFVKLYGQMAAILPYEMVEWEELFWFLKRLLPKMHVVDESRGLLFDLLDSVDLSTYALERVRLNISIDLEAKPAQLEPSSPNPRGAGETPPLDPLDEIIQQFNLRWFEGADRIPEDDRIFIMDLKDAVQNHRDFDTQFAQNIDPQNRRIALKRMTDDLLVKQRAKDMTRYKRVRDEKNWELLIDMLYRLLDNAG